MKPIEMKRDDEVKLSTISGSTIVSLRLKTEATNFQFMDAVQTVVVLEN